jgi:hypothetical protein
VADEGDIFLQAFSADARTVAVGELIAEAGAQARFADSFRDGGE